MEEKKLADFKAGEVLSESAVNELREIAKAYWKTIYQEDIFCEAKSSDIPKKRNNPINYQIT